MTALVLASWAVQAAAISIDEFYFHRTRQLGPWERFGHVFDVVIMWLTISLTLWLPPTPSHLLIYLFAGMASCLVVSKDEWIHARVCSGAELWLHSILFMMHPVVLAAGGWLWVSGKSWPWLWLWWFGHLGFALLMLSRALCVHAAQAETTEQRRRWGL